MAINNVENSNVKDIEVKSREHVDFSKIRVGLKLLEDAILNLDANCYSKANSKLGKKDEVLKAIANSDEKLMREISNFFFKTSGIYSRLCRYMAYLYRFDWMVTPYISDSSNMSESKTLATFHKVLLYLDNFQVKGCLGDIALKVIKNGCYYGYMIPKEDKMLIQELPANYCRSRYMVNGKPAVEFNMKYFDEKFKSPMQRLKILNLFPRDFKKGYALYKEGKLVADFPGDTSGWYLLDPEFTVKFNINGEDTPMFMSIIPAIIDLANAQELNKKKMAQRLLRIIVQKMPIDKNGDLVFDVDEAQQLHINAVRMLQDAIGVSVLTTFADVDVADMSDKSSTNSVDDLATVERTVFNEAGVSQMQFNTDGNIALEKSILNDEAALYNLIVQFETFLNEIIKRYNKTPKKVYYRVHILPTTIYNYKEMAKLYAEQTKIGYSKMLPQIALGQTQSSILATAFFENDILDLVNVFIPPMASNTMSADALKRIGTEKANETGKTGRPSKESQGEPVSEKTLQNQESMS